MSATDEAAEADGVEVFEEPLREYLYADVDRIQSVIAQFLGGTPQTTTGTNTRSGKASAGLKGYVEIGGERKSEDKVERSQLDALFPELERLLLTEGWLVDLERDFNDRDSGPLLRKVSPGSMVRLTASAQLFDAEYIARVFGGASTAMSGIPEAIGASAPTPPRGTGGAGGGGGRGGKNNRGPSQRASFQDTGKLEDLIEDFDAATFSGMNPGMLRGIVKTTRGMFLDGLHMVLSPRGQSPWTATARLQKDRRYLDAEADVLFSRYGMSPQEWTIVGTVGHFAQRADPASLQKDQQITGTEGVMRRAFIKMMNDMMSYIGQVGMSDAPPFPGFSIVPFAIYREIPRPGR